MAVPGAVRPATSPPTRSIAPPAKRRGPLAAAVGAALALAGARDAAAAVTLPLQLEGAPGLAGMYGGAIAAADFDGDGRPDLVMTGNFRDMWHSSDNPGGGFDEVRLYRNVSGDLGPIAFELVRVIPDYSGSRGSTLAVGDFDGDDRADFAVQMRQDADVAAFLNGGSWSFTRIFLQPGFGSGSNNSLGMAAADVDRDSRDDLVFISDDGAGGGLWYRFDPHARVWEPRQASFPHAITYGGTIAAGDLDGDGFPDIAVGGNSREPFGAHDCSSALQYGEVHLNRGNGSGFEMATAAVVSAFGLKVPPAERTDTSSCHGMDNAGMLIADLDLDGRRDVIIAGSSTGQDGVPGLNGQQYDFAVLFNRNGLGTDYEPWEASGPQDPCGGTSNGGQGNVDWPNIAVGDLSGDGLPDVFVQGHHRDYLLKWLPDCARNGGPQDPYVFEDTVFVNNGDRTFTTVPLAAWLPSFGPAEALPGGLEFLRTRPRYVGEGGQAIADFNGDGRPDLIFCGAELPFHTNGVNGRDLNTVANLHTYVLRSTAPGCAPIVFSPAAFPPAVAGQAYRQAVTASGGTAPYTFALSSGALPPPLSLDRAAGVVAGTPEKEGSYLFVLVTTDARGCTASRAYTVDVSPKSGARPRRRLPRA